MDAVKPRTMPGVMELLPSDQATFQRMLDLIRRGYERFGFQPIETPVMELEELLLTKSGGETEKQVYYAQSSGSRAKGGNPSHVLRFDLTVPLARYVAEHEGQLSFPFKRYQIQRVYRGESAQRGRFREFYQCDVDVIGKDSLALGYDAEIPVVIAHVFEELAVGAFTIRISNRKLLMGLLESMGIGPAQRVLVLREIDKLDRRGVEAVQKTLAEGTFGLDVPGVERLTGMLAEAGSNAEVLDRLEAADCDDATFLEGRRELAEVLAAIADFGVPEGRVRADLAIARGLDYYTGTVYETRLDEHPGIGSVCSGGRYDDLAGLYTKSRLPGVGISIGATRLFYQLQEAGLLQGSERSSTRVLVTTMDAALSAEYRALATQLRGAGLATELFSQGGKLGKQLKYASRAGIRFAVIMGADEHEQGTVMLKDLAAGDQEQLPRSVLAAAVLKRLERGDD